MADRIFLSNGGKPKVQDDERVTRISRTTLVFPNFSQPQSRRTPLNLRSSESQPDNAAIQTELAKIRPDVAAVLRRALHRHGLHPSLPEPEPVPPNTMPVEDKPKRARKAPKPMPPPIPLADRVFLTVKETAARYPLSESAIRALIFSAEAHAKHAKAGLRSNGFEVCIVRPPHQRKVLIDSIKLNAWLSSGGGK